jgi:rubrerythrin
MLKIKKKFVTNEANKKIAVQIDIKTFEKIEEILENDGLVKLMQETTDEESLDIEQAKNYYSKLLKV